MNNDRMGRAEVIQFVLHLALWIVWFTFFATYIYPKYLHVGMSQLIGKIGVLIMSHKETAILILFFVLTFILFVFVLYGVGSSYARKMKREKEKLQYTVEKDPEGKPIEIASDLPEFTPGP